MEIRLKRFLSLAMAIVMVIGMMPTNIVFATENGEDTPLDQNVVEETTAATSEPVVTEHTCVYTAEEVTKAATCTETGNKTLSGCSCGVNKTEEISALGHSHAEEVTKEATCTETGVKTFTCGACGDTYTEEIPVIGHNYVDGKCACGEVDPDWTPDEGDADGDDVPEETTEESTEETTVKPCVEGCWMEEGHEGECEVVCSKDERCVLEDGHEGLCEAFGGVLLADNITTEAALKTALAAGGDVKLAADITVSEVIEIPAGVTVTLDLAGHDIIGELNGSSTTNHIYALTNRGNLTIKDSGSDGTIKSRGVYNYGSLTLESGTIDACDGNGGYAVNNESGAIFIMNGGTLTASNEDGDAPGAGYDATPLDVPTGCTATLNGGSVTSVTNYTFAISAAGTLNVPANSTVVVQGNHGAIAVSGGTTTINGGTFKVIKDNSVRTDNVTYVSGGSLIINGGTFIGDSDTKAGGSCVCDEAGGATINGGSFSGSVGSDVNGTTGTKITGGTFEKDPSAYVAEGHAALPDLNGNFVVGTKPTATVTNLGAMTVKADEITWGGNGSDMPLNFVMSFKANEKDLISSVYDNWYADFVLTFNGIEGDSFTADGCYLAGFYGETESWNGMWAKVDVSSMKIDEGVRYPVMLGVGMGQLYNYVRTGVQEFLCAMYLTPEILEQNPNIKVKLELCVVDSSKGEAAAAAALVNKNNIYTVSSNEYTAEDFKHYVAQTGDKKYETLQAAINEAEPGQTVKLLDHIELTAFVNITKSLTLDLNTYSITRSDGTGLYINNADAEVVIKNGTIEVGKEGVYVGAAKKVDIYNCNVKSTGLSGSVYMQTSGVVNIYSGRFETAEMYNGQYFVLNIHDSSRANCSINVYGGTFVNFNPANNACEGQNTNFVADGYESINNGDGTYTVRLKKVDVKEPEKTDSFVEINDDIEVEASTIITEITSNEAIKKVTNENEGITLVITPVSVEVEMAESATYMTTTITYNVAPIDVTTGQKVSEPDQAITFNLPIPGSLPAHITQAEVFHKKDDVTIESLGEKDIQIGADGKRYVQVTSETFSEFEVELIDIDSESDVAKIGNTGYESLQAAINAVQSDETIVLLKNINLTGTAIINQSITLDLNGNNIENSDNNWVLKIDGNSTVTLTDSSEAKNGAIKGWKGISVVQGSKLIMNGGNINVNGEEGAGIQIYGSEAEMNGGKITAEYSAILIYSNNDVRGTFTMNDGEMETKRVSISANGSKVYDKVDVTVNAGKITSESLAIYWPAAGKLTIKGGEITGNSAVYVKSGSLEITNGTLTGNGEKKDYVHEPTSGVNLTGDALVIENVDNGGYEAADDIVIRGGTFISRNASAVASYAPESATAVTNFISGGIFSNEVPVEYCASDYVPVDNGDGTYGVKQDFTSSIDMSDFENDASSTIRAGAEIFVDGVSHKLTDRMTIVLSDDLAKKSTMFVTTYETGSSVAGKYPTKMYVWLVKGDTDTDQDGIFETFTVERILGLDNFFQYEGTSIRVDGSNNGIRFISSIDPAIQNALINGNFNGLAGAKMISAGTEFWRSEDNKQRSEVYGGAAGSNFRVFMQSEGRNWFTGVLTNLGHSDEIIVTYFNSRPYAVLEIGNEQVTLYGGILTRSIYDVAKQNTQEGTPYYDYVTGLIARGDAFIRDHIQED